MGGIAAPLNENMPRATLLSIALAFMLSSQAVDAAPSPCTDLQDLGFALSFRNQSPCKRTVYLGSNRIEPKYNPTFWKLFNMLESIEQSNLGKRANEEVEEKKKSYGNLYPFGKPVWQTFPLL